MNYLTIRRLLIVAIFITISDAATAHAGRWRKCTKRQSARHSQCVTPSHCCQPRTFECAPRAGSCICIQSSFVEIAGAHLYFAHDHPDKTQCNNYEDVIYESSSPLSSMQCGVQQCIDYRYVTGDVQLPEPVEHTGNLPAEIKLPANFRLGGEVVGSITTETGQVLNVRVFVGMLEVKHAGPPSEVYYAPVGIGFQCKEGAPNLAFKDVKATKHGNFDHLYEFEVGRVTYYAVTAD